jgi:hypothetical protein
MSCTVRRRAPAENGTAALPARPGTAFFLSSALRAMTCTDVTRGLQLCTARFVRGTRFPLRPPADCILRKASTTLFLVHRFIFFRLADECKFYPFG